MKSEVVVLAIALAFQIGPPSELAALPILKAGDSFTCADLAESANECISWGEAKAVRLLKWTAEGHLTGSDSLPKEISFHELRELLRKRDRTAWICRMVFTSKASEPLRPPAFGRLGLPDESMPPSRQILGGEVDSESSPEG